MFPHWLRFLKIKVRRTKALVMGCELLSLRWFDAGFMSDEVTDGGMSADQSHMTLRAQTQRRRAAWRLSAAPLMSCVPHDGGRPTGPVLVCGHMAHQLTMSVCL